MIQVRKTRHIEADTRMRRNGSIFKRSANCGTPLRRLLLLRWRHRAAPRTGKPG